MEASEQHDEQERAVTDRSESPETPQPTAPGQAPGEGAQEETKNPAAERELPAEDQSPVASDRDKAIVGDSGVFEQQPISHEGSAVNTPVRTSAPPASAQSGVPLAEDRARGVEPGQPGPVAPPSPEDVAKGAQVPEAPPVPAAGQEQRQT